MTSGPAGRKILIAGGGFNTAFIRYMAELTGKARPKLLYLPTASADNEGGTISWYKNCAPLNVQASAQNSFIESLSQKESWDEVLLAVDTTDSRPKELTIVKCLGFLKGSHSPHYDAEPGRRPLYHKLIGSGQMQPGYACDNDAGLYFVDNQIKRIVSARADAKCYHVTSENGKVVEQVLQPDMIS